MESREIIFNSYCIDRVTTYSQRWANNSPTEPFVNSKIPDFLEKSGILAFI